MDSDQVVLIIQYFNILYYRDIHEKLVGTISACDITYIRIQMCDSVLRFFDVRSSKTANEISVAPTRLRILNLTLSTTDALEKLAVRVSFGGEGILFNRMTVKISPRRALK